MSQGTLSRHNCLSSPRPWVRPVSINFHFSWNAIKLDPVQVRWDTVSEFFLLIFVFKISVCFWCLGWTFSRWFSTSPTFFNFKSQYLHSKVSQVPRCTSKFSRSDPLYPQRAHSKIPECTLPEWTSNVSSSEARY